MIIYPPSGAGGNDLILALMTLPWAMLLILFGLILGFGSGNYIVGLQLMGFGGVFIGVWWFGSNLLDKRKSK